MPDPLPPLPVDASEETTVSKPTFTPGPWRAGYADEQDRKGRMFVRAERVDGQPYVAVCPNPIIGSHEANARLIAAAPNLYEALAAYRKAQRRMLEQWSECDERARRDLWVDLHRCQLAADAALAKAEGR